MITREDIEDMRAYLPQLFAAVAREDMPAIRDVYEKVGARFHAEGPHAVAMLLVEELAEERKRFRRILRAANEEAAANGAGYLDQKRRAEEWKSINQDQAKTIARQRALIDALKHEKREAA